MKSSIFLYRRKRTDLPDRQVEEYIRVDPLETISWCYAHNNNDIHKQREDSTGNPWACRKWHPDDECHIAMAQVLPLYEEEL